MDARRRLTVNHRRIALRLGWLALVCALATGCSSSGYLKIRRVPRNPLEGPLQLLSRGGPRPTERTVQLLRRYDLDPDQLSPELFTRLESELIREPTIDKTYALAELAYVGGSQSALMGHENQALDLFGVAVAYAYLYLFDPRFDAQRNPYDPQFRRTCDLYNSALESAIRTVSKRGQLKPGETVAVQSGEQQFMVHIVTRGAWRDSEIERLEFSSDFEVVGLRNRHHRYGLGVPLTAVRRRQSADSRLEQYYPASLSFPVTAFLRVVRHPNNGSGEGGIHHCVLELFDPLVSTDIMVADRRVPLETDISTPLAYTLEHPSNNKLAIATGGLLNPESTDENQGLYMVEPFHPNKIPVLMVHGLWSSPLTWMELFNDLRAFPEIRDRYQFWFYLYPTGQPFWISAIEMRDELNRMRSVIDPERRYAPLDQMVVVGHSMGGLVSKLQTLHSGDNFLNVLTNRSLDELKASPEDKSRVARAVFFEPNPSIGRVITIGTPHRGSEFANDITRYLAHKFIRLPTQMLQRQHRMITDNPGFFRDTDLLTIATSIDSLSPESPIFPAMLDAQQASWTRYHNIVGVAGEDHILARFTERGDGIVSYDSAHLADVESELTVEADHMNVHLHPRSILEVRRILLEHARRLNDPRPSR